MRPLCSVCGNKKSRFLKEQEAKGILSGDKFMPELDVVDPIVKNTVHVDHL